MKNLQKAEAYWQPKRGSTKAFVQRCSVKKVFMKILQNSQENTCARIFFLNKVTDLRPATLLKERLWRSSFPVSFAKFIRTSFCKEHLWWLLIYLRCSFYGDILNVLLLLQTCCIIDVQLVIYSPPKILKFSKYSNIKPLLSWDTIYIYYIRIHVLA